jgi:sugar (pentulose or hexulose) kinase
LKNNFFKQAGMEKSNKNIAVATLDIGTSQIKMGVYCPSLSDKLIFINSLPNDLIYGAAGEVRTDYRVTRDKCFALLTELGAFLQKNHIGGALHIGVCGHISSLIEWNKRTDTPPEQPFPIWLDTTSYPCLDEYDAVMGEGRSKDIIGLFLPSGTNWLLTKLMHRRRSGWPADSIFLQVGDCLFHELSGEYRSHFSSQLSMADVNKKAYAKELLDHLKLADAALPAIDPAACPVLEVQKKRFGFPDESIVYPALADLHPSLYGLRLRDREGFLLANTSEQTGVFYRHQPEPAENFLHIAFDRGFINYGSSNTGGNLISWLVGSVLNKALTPAVLDELTLRAAAIGPEETPIILPYLQGERAPLWDSKLTASILELRSSHGDGHLFRAVLESVGFARRQCFQALGIGQLELIKIAGGSSKNGLWNAIRASVLNKPIAVADEKELAMAGLVDYIMGVAGDGAARGAGHAAGLAAGHAAGLAAPRPVIGFAVVEPDPDQIKIYDEKYRRFIHYQGLLI